jgi:hypothetical protein
LLNKCGGSSTWIIEFSDWAESGNEWKKQYVMQTIFYIDESYNFCYLLCLFYILLKNLEWQGLNTNSCLQAISKKEYTALKHLTPDT